METTPLQLTIYPSASGSSSDSAANSFLTKGGSFKDILDTINPLQQLPVIGSVYRSLTGDTISPGSRIAGGTLYGGPLGLLSAIFNEISTTQTGKDIGGNIMAMIQGEPVQSASSADAASTDPVSSLTPHQQKSYNSYVLAQSMTA